MEGTRELLVWAASGIGGLAGFLGSGYVLIEIFGFSHPILFFFLALPIMSGSAFLTYHAVRQWLERLL